MLDWSISASNRCWFMILVLERIPVNSVVLRWKYVYLTGCGTATLGSRNINPALQSPKFSVCRFMTHVFGLRPHPNGPYVCLSPNVLVCVQHQGLGSSRSVSMLARLATAS